jgi:hypothetical protein
MKIEIGFTLTKINAMENKSEKWTESVIIIICFPLKLFAFYINLFTITNRQ